MNTTDLKLVIGKLYNFKNQSERLIYIGQSGAWHQFQKTGRPEVWAEVLSTDLYLLEESEGKAEISLAEFTASR